MTAAPPCFRNDPESRNLTAEATLFENARQAVGLPKKTFETWIVIGKAVVAARGRADRIGGGKTFRRILEQQGLASVVPPATASRLIAIMERLGEVTTWHAGLPEQCQIAWAAPSAILKHCPALKKPGGKQPARAAATNFPQLHRINAFNGATGTDIERAAHLAQVCSQLFLSQMLEVAAKYRAAVGEIIDNLNENIPLDRPRPRKQSFECGLHDIINDFDQQLYNLTSDLIDDIEQAKDSQ